MPANNSELIYPELSYKIQGCFFEVYNSLGFGHKEVLYQRALAKELELQGINFEREKKINVTYKGKFIGNYTPDFLIDDKIIIEIKALSFLHKSAVSQTLNYLKGTKYKLAYLVNFGGVKLELKRMVWTKEFV